MGELYKSAGYEPFLPTAEQLAAVRALDAALADATRNEMLAAATASPRLSRPQAARPTTLLAAATDIAARIAERAAVVEGQQQPAASRSAADAKVEAGHAALRPLRSKVEWPSRPLSKPRRWPNSTRGRQQLAAATAADLEKARRGLGVQLPLDEIVFIPGLPVRSSRGHGSGRRRGERSCAVGDEQSDDDRLVRRPRRSAAVEAGDGSSHRRTGFWDQDEVVEEVENTPGTDGVDGYHIYFAVRY